MKRRVLIILFLLLLGAAVNVTVAWACVCVPLPLKTVLPHYSWADGSPMWIVWGLEFRTTEEFKATGPPSDVPTGFPDRVEYVVKKSPRFGMSFEAGWSEDDFVPPAQVVLKLSSGWPMRSMRCRAWASQGHEHLTVTGAIDLTNWKASPIQLLCLPFTPAPFGFVVNSVFYAIVLFVVLPGPLGLRWLIRLKRGRCPKCGYDLRGDLAWGCSECGWNRQPEATA
ncbi:MAG: hypothetical protein SYC29_08140 [Planctomycetota bacterium]|nr:hypothetical protein [Planctomycetota bacterium]